MIRHVQQKKMFHKHSVWEHEAEASHNAEQGHLEGQIYAVQLLTRISLLHVPIT